MSKEISPLTKWELEILDKRELLEETLTVKMLREIPHKTPIEAESIIFRVQEPYAFQDLIVMKIVGNKAEVIPHDEMRENKPISMLSFDVSELWAEDDYSPIRNKVNKMSSVEIAAKIAELDSQSNLTN
ncbi:MAG: hypothetical protein G01um101444_225 [Parcubacteria group bacterium Gr01-1014_44]|nr:MAG: hypothetical protein G01um101444_225 [Parcubacteria group bacterium Gr01-1014_44]